MTPKGFRKSLCLVFVLFITICNTSRAQHKYTDFIQFKKVLYELSIVTNGDSTAYDVQLKGPRVHIGSTGATEELRLKQYDTIARISFDTSRTVIGGESVPFSFEAGTYKMSCVNLLARFITNTTGMSGALISKLSADEELDANIVSSYSRIKEKLLKVIVKQLADSSQREKEREIALINQGHTRTFDSLVAIIDQTDEENRYGGYFVMADTDSTGIPVYYRPQKDTAAKNAGRHQVFDTQHIRFYADTIVIKTFNNFVDQIVVVGYLYYYGKKERVAFYNGSYSIPLKHLFQRKQSLGFTIPFALEDIVAKQLKITDHEQMPVSNRYIYYVNISDLIQLRPYRHHFTFMAKNDSYRLTRREKAARYVRREFYDYLNFTTFLDFLGVMEKQPNSLIQIDGRLRLPLRLVNSAIKKSYSNVWFPKLDINLNAAFVNGSQSDDRFGTIYNESADPQEQDKLYIDNFDLVRKYNIKTGFELGILKKEGKATNINLYMDYGFHFYRTTLRYVIVNNEAADEEERFGAWSYAHGPIIRAEYRPDQNIGGDMSFAVNLNQKMLNSDNDNLFVSEIRGPINKNKPPTDLTPVNAKRRANFKMELNAYFLVSPGTSNGGLYFRLANYFNYNFSQVFPQVMVGYSTRLTGMIKNFRNGKADR